mmetsp:Transcript_5361/g.21126  ORF Transcript_5361/g.21126 Transcript_5361/m.21126 type:complete len:204 (+) Transcript_5361:1519-2130(+)
MDTSAHAACTAAALSQRSAPARASISPSDQHIMPSCAAATTCSTPITPGAHSVVISSGPNLHAFMSSTPSAPCPAANKSTTNARAVRASSRPPLLRMSSTASVHDAEESSSAPSPESSRAALQRRRSANSSSGAAPHAIAIAGTSMPQASLGSHSHTAPCHNKHISAAWEATSSPARRSMAAHSEGASPAISHSSAACPPRPS